MACGGGLFLSVHRPLQCLSPGSAGSAGSVPILIEELVKISGRFLFRRLLFLDDIRHRTREPDRGSLAETCCSLEATRLPPRPAQYHSPIFLSIAVYDHSVFTIVCEINCPDIAPARSSSCPIVRSPGVVSTVAHLYHSVFAKSCEFNVRTFLISPPTAARADAYLSITALLFLHLQLDQFR